MVYTYTRITCRYGLDKPINQTITTSNTPVVHFSEFVDLATEISAILPLWRLNFPFTSTLASITEKIFRALILWHLTWRHFFSIIFLSHRFSLLERCWSINPLQRPTSSAIVQELLAFKAEERRKTYSGRPRPPPIERRQHAQSMPQADRIVEAEENTAEVDTESPDYV